MHPYKKRHSIAIGLSFLMVPLVMMVLVYHIRHSPNYRELSPDYRMVLVPSVVGSTLAKQLLAALPGVYLLFDPSRLFSSETFRREVLRHVWLVILVLPLTGYLLRKMAQQEHPSLLPWARVGLLGLLLALLPALPIAVCFRYQQELSYGLGYLPVYIQYFGVALLLLSLLVQLLRLTRGRLLPQMLVLTLAGVAVSALTVLHYACNQMVVHAYRPLAQLRPQIEEVVRAGGLGSFPAGSLLVADSFMWDTANHGAYFYTMHTGTILHFASSQELPPNLRSQSLTAALSTQRDLFRIRYADIYQDDGFIAVGQLTRLESLPTGRLSRSFLVLNRIAVRERSLGGKPLKQTFFGLTANSAASEAPVHLPRSAFRLVQKTGCWAIYEPAADGPVLDGESIRVLFDRHYPLVFSWRKGFCDREGAEASTWHWCASSHGDIAVRNPTPFARTVRITMRCASAQQGTGYHLTIDAPHYHAGVPLSSALSEEVSWTMQAAPGQSVIHFICDAPPVTPGGNDTRSLFFRIDAFAAREIDSAAHLEYDCTQVFEGSP